MQRKYTRERIASLKTGAGFQQPDIHMQKNKFGSLPHTTFEREFKIDFRAKCKDLKI